MRLSPLLALLALGCSQAPSATDAGTDAPSALDAGADAGQAPDVPLVVDVAAPRDAGVDASDAVAVPDAAREDAGPVCPSCPVPPGALATCEGGSCGWTCARGRADCDRNEQNGCEVDIGADTRNCGSCGAICPSVPRMVATCVSGACGAGPLVCTGPLANCDDDVTNGCEVDTRSSVSNCGGCGVQCAYANATAECRAGLCAFGACAAGFADCNANPADGCEVDTRADTRNCGACGAVCSFPNASPMCSSGSCGIASCNAGWCNRNRITSDGCEFRGPCS